MGTECVIGDAPSDDQEGDENLAGPNVPVASRVRSQEGRGSSTAGSPAWSLADTMFVNWAPGMCVELSTRASDSGCGTVERPVTVMEASFAASPRLPNG